LLNDARLNADKAPLGFLNPWIYSNPSMFTDIVIGNNAHSCCAGFTCVPGYDAVTGFGTPIWSAMKESALSLP
jgi:tripeptidyl-peptidase I